MSLFEDREQAFGSLLDRKDDVQIRACALRNRMVAAWAAERMALPEDDAAAYESFVVQLGHYFGEEGVRDRLLHDLELRGVGVSEHRLRRLMDDFHLEPAPELDAGRVANQS